MSKLSFGQSYMTETQFKKKYPERAGYKKGDNYIATPDGVFQPKEGIFSQWLIGCSDEYGGR